MAANSRSSIEFVVKPKQDLHLEGQHRRLPRVAQGESYPCQMQKTQTFSCLFRHYAKHNGLRKEDLVFSFVDDLLPDQTPESVHLMPHDEIWVEHRKCDEEDSESSSSSGASQFYGDQFRKLLDSGTHADMAFVFEAFDRTDRLLAHKAILSARCEYFEAMFREGGMLESSKKEISVRHAKADFKRLLEYIYTNSVREIETLGSDEVISLLMLANEYLLADLRSLCESAVVPMISLENISKLWLLSTGHNAPVLKDACAEFFHEHKVVLVNDPIFRQEIEVNPELGLLLLESTVSKAGDVGSAGKKRRRSSSEADIEIPSPAPTTTNTVAATNIDANTNTIA